MTGTATAAQRLLALDPADVAALTFELSQLCEHTASRRDRGAGRPVRSAARRAGPAARRTASVPCSPPERRHSCHHISSTENRTPIPTGPSRVRQPGEPLRIGDRRPGRLRQDRTGRRAVPPAARRTVAGGADQRHLHHRGRRLPAPARGAARRPDRRRADRRLPAHRDPRRHHRQPRRDRRPDRRAHDDRWT